MEEETEEFVDGLRISLIGREAGGKPGSYRYVIQLESKYKAWKVEIDPETEIAANQTKIIQIQNSLEKWLHTLQSRTDVLGAEEFHDFLNLGCPGTVELRMCNHPAALFYSHVILGEFRISDILVCESIGLIVCAHEDYEPMNKVGMIWSMIEVETFGVLTFWSYSHADPRATKQIAKLQFEQRISRLLQDKESKYFILGTDDGEMQIIPREVILEKKALTGGHFRTKLVSGRIIGLLWLIEGKILAVAGTDNHLKLFDFSSVQIVGGGSLNKRLEGGSLTSMQVDQVGSRVFLGTSKGTVMVYHINSANYQPSHIYTIALGAGELSGVSVGSLLFSHGNIFVGCGSQVLVYNVTGTAEPKSFAIFSVYDKALNASIPEEPSKVTSLAYSHTKNTIVAGCSDGTLMTWSSVHGDVTGAFKTGLMGAITKLQLTSKDKLIGGTLYSLLIIWEIFDTILTTVPKKDPGKPNMFDTAIGRYEEKKQREEFAEETKGELIESLDSP